MEPDHSARAEAGPTARRSAGSIAAAIATGLVLLFAVLNLQRVQMDWILTSTRAPLIVVIVLFALLGFVSGWFVANHRRR